MKNETTEMFSLAHSLWKAGAKEHGETLFKAAFAMSSQSRTAEDDSEAGQAEKTLNAELKRFPKKSAWWDEPKNYAINMTLMGTLNDWRFSILPMRAAAIGYRPANPERNMPEGIVIDPGWTTQSGDPVGGGSAIDPTPANVAELIKFAKSQPTVQQTVAHELRWLETKFGIKVPSEIEAKLVREAPKVASRRWGINRLRVKKILLPFDGSKAIELSSWG